MKLPFVPSRLELPASLATCILGAAVSALGGVAATVTGWWVRLANIDPAELAIQRLHGVLVGVFIAMSAFLVLILRAVWGKGIETVNPVAAEGLNEAHHIAGRVGRSFAALKQASLGDPLKSRTCGRVSPGIRTNSDDVERWIERFVMWIHTRLPPATRRVNATETTATHLFSL